MQHNSLAECIHIPYFARLDLGARSMVLPTKGVVYTINEIVDHAYQVWVSLFEIPDLDEHGEPHYYSIDCFREILPPFSISDELFSHAPETCEV